MSSITGDNSSTQNITNTNDNETITEDIEIIKETLTGISYDISTDTTNIQNNLSLGNNDISLVDNLSTNSITLNGNDLGTILENQENDIAILQAEQITQNTNISANTSKNNAQDASINSILGRITDIQYNSGADTTFIFNRLQIRSGIDNTVGATPMLTLYNTSSQPANQIQCQFMAGVERLAWNNLSQEGDCLFLTRNFTGVAGSYKGGMVFCTHGGANAFRFSYDADIPSVFRSNVNMEANQLTTTGNITAGTITLAGEDLTTTLNTLSSSIATNTTNISTNTTNIATNTANIASNTADILALEAIDHSILTTDLNCAGYDLLNVGEINSTDIVSNHITTEDLKIVSVGAGPETIIQTTTNSGTCNMGITAPSGTATQLKITTQNSAVVSKDFTISHNTIDTNDRIISNLNTCMGYYVDMGTSSAGMPASGTVYSIVNPDYVIGANLVTLYSNHIKFNSAGLYRIHLAWTHVSDHGFSGGGTDVTVMTGQSASDDVPSPFLNELLDHSFNGVSNDNNGFDIVTTSLYPMRVDENSSYRFLYTVKNGSNDVVRPNRWNLSYLAEMGENQSLYFKMRADYAWSTDRHRFVIQKLV